MPDSNPHHADRPNVLLIIMDDLAWGDLACHGNPYTHTPHLDRLHAESTRLTRYHAYPVCTPTRSALMTGRHPYRTRAIDTFCGRSMIDPDERTLPEMLRDAGYTTGISGKWHLGDCYPMRAIDKGFNHALAHNGGGLCQPANWGHDHYFDPDLLHNGKLVRRQGYCTDIFTDDALAFMTRHQHEPFFCYLATNAPHTPLHVDEAWTQRYRAQSLDDVTAKLYGMVENIDHNVGRALGKLEELGIADRTIVIYVSDHGPCVSANGPGRRVRWNANLRSTKGTPYDGGLRVPMFIRWPKRIADGRDLDRLSGPMDVMPTLAHLCNASLPDDRTIDGVDLAPLLLERAKPDHWPQRQLFSQWHRGDVPQRYRNFAVIEQRWKLVCSRLGAQPWNDDGAAPGEGELTNMLELYDVSADPGETQNLAAQHPDVVARLRAAYDAWFDDVSRTRGETTYDPPPIHLGACEQNPTVLTRQDRRLYPERGAQPDSWDIRIPGWWMVHVARPGGYSVRVRVTPADDPRELVLRCGEVSCRAMVPAGAAEQVLHVVLEQAGPARVELLVHQGDETLGIDRAEIWCDELPATGTVRAPAPPLRRSFAR